MQRKEKYSDNEILTKNNKKRLENKYGLWVSIQIDLFKPFNQIFFILKENVGFGTESLVKTLLFF
jgi:hypothetical protein